MTDSVGDYPETEGEKTTYILCRIPTVGTFGGLCADFALSA